MVFTLSVTILVGGIVLSFALVDAMDVLDVQAFPRISTNAQAGVVVCSAPRNSDQCIMGVEAPGEAHWDEETAAVHTRVQVQGRP